MIVEVGADNYAEGVRQSLEHDLVVVRGMASLSTAAALADHSPPREGKIRAYTHPLARRPFVHEIDCIEETKPEVHTILRDNFGCFATLGGLYLQEPDQIRRGCVTGHIDDRTILLSTSVNFDNAGQETTFYARRVAESDAHYREVQKNFYKWRARRRGDHCSITLGVGDGAIISRGVAHGSEGSPERSSATYRTRGLVV